LRVVKNSLARVARNVAHSLPSALHVLYRLTRSATNFILVGQSFGFRAQTFRAARDSLCTTLGSLAGDPCAFTNQIRDRVFLVNLAGFAARRLLPLVQLFLVISHSYPRDASPRFPSPCTSPAAIEFDRGGSIATTRSRPLRLASYKATSAAFSTSAAVCAS